MMRWLCWECFIRGGKCLPQASMSALLGKGDENDSKCRLAISVATPLNYCVLEICRIRVGMWFIILNGWHEITSRGHIIKDPSIKTESWLWKMQQWISLLRLKDEIVSSVSTWDRKHVKFVWNVGAESGQQELLEKSGKLLLHRLRQFGTKLIWNWTKPTTTGNIL